MTLPDEIFGKASPPLVPLCQRNETIREAIVNIREIMDEDVFDVNEVIKHLDMIELLV